ncbi:MAG: alpha/beta hydrolase [Ktedonobacterales bacterium]
MAAPVEYAVTFPSAGRPSLLLEGALARPAAAGDTTLRAAAVICHPQPATSTMDDELCRRQAHALAAAGVVALRFNFRGVGASEGQQTDGRLEPLDIAGAVEFALAQPNVNPAKVCLIGHAFGAFMALAYAEHDARIGTVVAVSPPIYRLGPQTGGYSRPKLVVTGEHDEVAPRHKLEPWLEHVPNRALRVVNGARHLMRGYEDVTCDVVVSYVTRWAAMPGV